MPWHLRWALIIGSFVGVIAVAWFTYDFGRSLAGYQSGQAQAEQARLAEELDKLRTENASLRTQLATQEGQLQIDASTHGNLAGQMKALTDENALLKEDLAFFQTLMTASGGSQTAISINRFRVRPDALPGEYRYQLLVVQSRTRSREFQGRLQLVVDLVANGRTEVLVLPAAGDKGEPYNLNFKFYQRMEGVFNVPPATAVKRVQARVLEHGSDAPLSSQTINLS